MELSKLIEEKRELEKNILKLIQIFQQKTDGYYEITGIDLIRHRQMDDKHFTVDVEIEGRV
jgi:hypothetical protein